MEIEEVEGIGPTNAAALRGAGVETTEALLGFAAPQPPAAAPPVPAAPTSAPTGRDGGIWARIKRIFGG